MGTRAGRGDRRAAARHLVAEPTWRKATRDLLSLAFVIGAIYAGIRAGGATGDVGLGIGVGFAVCFVGAVVISRTVIAPDQKPAPRWAVVMSLVTSPLVIAAGIIELRDDVHPTGDLRLFCGVAGLFFGLDQWAQRGRLRRRVARDEAARQRAEHAERFPVVPASVFAPFAAADPDAAEEIIGSPEGTETPHGTTRGARPSDLGSPRGAAVHDGSAPPPTRRRRPRLDGRAPTFGGPDRERHLRVAPSGPDATDGDGPDPDLLPPHRW